MARATRSRRVPARDGFSPPPSPTNASPRRTRRRSYAKRALGTYGTDADGDHPNSKRRKKITPFDDDSGSEYNPEDDEHGDEQDDEEDDITDESESEVEEDPSEEESEDWEDLEDEEYSVKVASSHGRRTPSTRHSSSTTAPRTGLRSNQSLSPDSALALPLDKTVATNFNDDCASEDEEGRPAEPQEEQADDEWEDDEGDAVFDLDLDNLALMSEFGHDAESGSSEDESADNASSPPHHPASQIDAATSTSLREISDDPASPFAKQSDAATPAPGGSADFLAVERAIKPLPADTKAGGVRRRRKVPRKFSLPQRPKSWSVRKIISFGSVCLGKDPKALSEDQKQACEAAFDRGMMRVVRRRCQQAASDEPDSPQFPISEVFREWMNEEKKDKIFNMIRDAITRERRIVLGGMFLGYTQFSDLPLPTDEELDSWLVYGDLVKLSKTLQKKLGRKFRKSMYVGSRTAGQGSGHGGARIVTYVKAKEKAMRGDGVSASNLKSYHLQTALQDDAQMRIRVIAIFDPVLTPIKHVLGAEGFFVDYLQSYSKDLGRADGAFHSAEMLRASMEACPDLDNECTWDGLNRAHPFRQGVRGCPSRAIRFFQLHGFLCLCCNRPRNGKSVYMTTSLNREDLPAAICGPCYARVHKYPDETVEQIRHARNRNRSEVNMSILYPDLDSYEKRRELLDEQDSKCYACREPDIEPHLRTAEKAWTRYWRVCPAQFHHCKGTIICQACEQDWMNQAPKGPVAEDAWFTTRNSMYTTEQFLRDVNAPPEVKMTPSLKVRAKQWHTTMRDSWIMLMANEYRCFCCKEAKWTQDYPWLEGNMYKRTNPKVHTVPGVYRDAPICQQCWGSLDQDNTRANGLL